MGPQPAAVEAVCKDFKKAFADKTLTLTFDIRDNLKPLRQLVPILPEAPGEYQYNKYAVLFGDLCLGFGQSHVPPKPAQNMGSGAFAVTVKARQPALLEAAVLAGPQGNCTKSNLWSGLIEVGQLGQEYEIPIPAAKPFGKQVFAATFDEAGALTLLSYNKDSGEGDLLATALTAGQAIQKTNAGESCSAQ